MRPAALVPALALLAACGAPRPAVGPPGDAFGAGGLTLAADASSYARNQPIALTLRNAGSATYEGGVVSCAVAERWEGQAWVRAEDDERACVMMLVQIAPGETLTGEVALDVAPGSYRLAHTMNAVGADSSVTVATRAFRIGTGRARPQP